MKQGFLVLSAFAIAMVGCRRSDPPPTDAGMDAGDFDAGDFDAGVAEPAPSEAMIAVSTGISAAAALAAPMVQDAEQLRDTPDALPGAAREGATRTRVEDGVAGNSIVTDPACVTFDWTAIRELRVTITFASCTLEATGEPLDGMLSMQVLFGPSRVAMEFTALTIGTIDIDGSLELAVGGVCRVGDTTCVRCADADTTCMAAQANQRTLNADLTVSSGAGFAITLDAVQIDADATGRTINGAGTIASTAFTGTFTATDVFANTGDCLASGGSVDLDDGRVWLGVPVITTMTFLPTTPADGEVYLQVNGFPDIAAVPPPPTTPMFMACP